MAFAGALPVSHAFAAHRHHFLTALRVQACRVYGACGCRMRLYYRDPRWELLPQDNVNYVPAIYRMAPSMMFRLAVPFPFVIDPTRKLHNCTRLVEFDREQVGGPAWWEMRRGVCVCVHGGAPLL